MLHKRNAHTNEQYAITYNILPKGDKYWKIGEESIITFVAQDQIKCNHDKASKQLIENIAGTYDEIKITNVVYI